MGLSRRLRLGAAAAALAVGGAGAVLLPSAPAVAYFSPPLFLDVHVQSPLQLLARGAAVDVPVEFTCTSQEAFVSVTVTQRANNGVAQGSGVTTVGCTRQRQRTTVTVTASSGGKSFRAGTAFAEAQIFGCVESFCGDERDAATVTIVK